MAIELSDYLQGSYLDEKRDIQRLQKISSQVLDAFDRFFLTSERVWPYEVVDGQDIPSSVDFSFSTNAMIVFSLAVATGRVSTSQLVPLVRQAPLPPRNEAQSKSLSEAMKSALARFPVEMDSCRESPEEVKRWTEAQVSRKRSAKVPLATTSSTFGPNDPLTLTWLLEVLGDGTPADRQDQEHLVRYLKPAAREIIDSTFQQPAVSPLRLEPHETVTHAFTLLRVLQLSHTAAVRARGWQPSRGVDQIHDFLLNRAHFHLALTSVHNAGFDAGELVFSLEGVLLCDPSLPDYSLFDRAFEVLAERQRETPYWRPLRPFRVTSQGMVLLPQSVEIANSLLRICSRLDENRHQSYFSDYIHLFKAYTRWLESRMFVGRTKRQREDDIFGWQSEHTFAPDRIHCWLTSQVLLYLMHYATMLQGHVARLALTAARFSVASTESTGRPDLSSWEHWEESEPMGSLSKKGRYAVYRRLGDSIIRPRVGGGRPTPDLYSSALLYGPPGTGKSRIAKEMAKALGYRRITITPSDFITAGQEGAEARAKNIFMTLMEQTDLVVQFDEVDQLLLDRESGLYWQQGDIFKLITPGMLTKLNDLTERKEVVFVVATNFFERIDPAIKRPGRINQRLLVLPPDAGQRMRFLTAGSDGKTALLPSWETLTEEQKDEVVRETALYTYGELEDLAAGMVGAKGEGVLLRNKILAWCSESPSTISIASYKSRVLKQKDGEYEVDEKGPLEEFVMVVYLAAESARVRDSDQEWLRKPLAAARRLEAVGSEQGHVWQVLEESGALNGGET